MKRGRFFIIFVVILIIFSIVLLGVISNRSNTSGPVKVTFKQLVDKRVNSQYNDQNVLLSSYIFLGFETSVLCEKLIPSGYREGHYIPAGNLIWIEGGVPSDIKEGLYKQKQSGYLEYCGYIRITGSFKTGGQYGYLGGYEYQIIPSKVKLLSWQPEVK